jgi:hypothetical protein
MALLWFGWIEQDESGCEVESNLGTKRGTAVIFTKPTRYPGAQRLRSSSS